MTQMMAAPAMTMWPRMNRWSAALVSLSCSFQLLCSSTDSCAVTRSSSFAVDDSIRADSPAIVLGLQGFEITVATL